jgi:nucleotide-binding universal stress UspA family protein
MFRNVLVGVDGRQGGRDAVALARQLAPMNATFTLAHVCTPFSGQGAVELLPIELEEAQQMLVRERELAGIDAQLLVGRPQPAGSGLHELAQKHRIDLLVVGSTRRAVIGRLLLGDDCRATVDGAPCAVGVAPRGYGLVPHELERVGVGYDGSLESAHALVAARELASAHAGTVKAFWVVSLQDVRQDKPIPADWPDAIEELLESRSAELAELEVEGTAAYGGPREELVRAGKELDLLIVGSRGYGPVGRLLHGSVSGYLVRHATCPLLVLPRQALTERDERQLSLEAARA